MRRNRRYFPFLLLLLRFSYAFKRSSCSNMSSMAREIDIRGLSRSLLRRENGGEAAAAAAVVVISRKKKKKTLRRKPIEKRGRKPPLLLLTTTTADPEVFESGARVGEVFPHGERSATKRTAVPTLDRGGGRDSGRNSLWCRRRRRVVVSPATLVITIEIRSSNGSSSSRVVAAVLQLQQPLQRQQLQPAEVRPRGGECPSWM